MFEKSLYDLIRGLRSHKGNEREYIQNSIRECRNEVRSSDMDLKATALLKLVYLEMFGHDMSWASFHVLEVMSSSKYPQKRVGYLGAVQSFRPDTEVLMLATNMLKKDVTSVPIPTISLPLITLPHIITPSLAVSILPDLLPRLSHSSPNIRKKTVVTLYRLALTYPETLRPAWPKIKDMLMNDGEDSSVTAAVINVVCELGWRRPHDFLPLAPRLFDLLVDGGNNWMAIKIIKLFATLTPLEPRLIKKLLPPLINLIKTTPAMSLLYECISGIIQGGILEGHETHQERDEVAELCVGKLRGMVAVDGDPNLKYVALLAFNRIVSSHPQLVAMHQDVILECIDDPDISIRLQALQLGSGMINSNNLQEVVERLMRQLRDAYRFNDSDIQPEGLAAIVEPMADSDSEDAEVSLRHKKPGPREIQALPNEYRTKMIGQILNMCSRETYVNVVDFEWYVDILVELVRVLPAGTGSVFSGGTLSDQLDDTETIAAAVGIELRTVAVRVLSIRPYAVQAADSLMITDCKLLLSEGEATLSIPHALEFAAWIVGEYSHMLSDPHRTLDAILSHRLKARSPRVLCAYLQAIPKILSAIFTVEKYAWTTELQARTSLLFERVIRYMEGLIEHPCLEIQERSTEFLELMRVSKEATETHGINNSSGPIILSEVVPSLFNSQELNPVAFSAQRKVPIPEGVDLALAINANLQDLLKEVEVDSLPSTQDSKTRKFYYQRVNTTVTRAAFDALPDVERLSYQNGKEEFPRSDEVAKRADRRTKNREDPFYIASDEQNPTGVMNSLDEILKSSNGQEFEIDSIPIMHLDLGDTDAESYIPRSTKGFDRKKPKQDVLVTAEETLDETGTELRPSARLVDEASDLHLAQPVGRKVLLQVDSSGIGKFSLRDEANASSSFQARDRMLLTEDDEMTKALANVEKMRMELQRASERVDIPDEISAGGTLVKKMKKKKKKPKSLADASGLSKLETENGQEFTTSSDAIMDPETISRRKKKKKRITEPAIME